MKMAAVIAFLAATFVADPAAAATCESLKSLTIPSVTIVSAESVAAGPFVQPGRSGAAPAAATGGPQTGGGRGAAAPSIPAHCRVKLVLKPSSDMPIITRKWASSMRSIPT